MNDLTQPAAAIPVPEHLVEVGEHDRSTYVGGSGVAAILGIDPYGKTPLSYYHSKIGEGEGITDPEKLKFLARRKRWEEPIVAMLREEFDGNIGAVNRRFIERDVRHFGAEIDFEWIDAEGNAQNGEIKTVSPFAFNEGAGWGEAGSDMVPIHYHAQVQWGLGIMRRQTCILAALAGLDTMVFYRIERDDELIEQMRQAVHDFWTNNVMPRVPPEPISMSDVARLMNRRNGKPVELDDEHAQAFEQLRRVREALKAHGGDEAELELKVAKFICKAWGFEDTVEPPVVDNAVLTHGGVKLGTWARGRGASLDQRRLAIEHPEIKAEYMREHFYRAFKFVKPKAA